MTLIQQDAPLAITPNRYARNSEVYLTEKCTQDNPMWLKQAQLRAVDVVNKIPFKVKSVIARGVNVWYTLERNGVSIFNVPEEYLKESISDFPAGYMEKHLPKAGPEIGRNVLIEVASGINEICKIVNVGNFITLQRANGNSFDVRGDFDFEYITNEVVEEKDSTQIDDVDTVLEVTAQPTEEVVVYNKLPERFEELKKKGWVNLTKEEKEEYKTLKA